MLMKAEASCLANSTLNQTIECRDAGYEKIGNLVEVKELVQEQRDVEMVEPQGEADAEMEYTVNSQQQEFGPTITEMLIDYLNGL